MKALASRLFSGLLLWLLTGFLLLNFLAWHHARTMLRYAPPGGLRTEKPEALNFLGRWRVLLLGVCIPRPADPMPPAALATNAQALSIPVSNAITLCAWYAPAGGPNAPLAIFFHGYSTEKTRLLREAREIHGMGASVLLVDFRGSGGSSEAYTTLGWHEADDVAAAVRYARSHLPHSALILYGQSMGSAAILRAFRIHDLQPDAIILEAVFDTLLNAIRNRFQAMRVPSFPSAELLVFWGGVQFGFNGYAHRPLADARAATCPALVLHGAADPRATLTQARRVYETLPGPKHFVAFEGTGHESLLARHPDLWRDTLREFLLPWLLNSPPGRAPIDVRFPCPSLPAGHRISSFLPRPPFLPVEVFSDGSSPPSVFVLLIASG